MKVKKIKIKVMEMGKWFDETESVLKDFNNRMYKRYQKTVSFANLALLRKTLTPRRMQLLSIIRHQKPESIYELANMVKRDRKAVTVDIDILEELGFIELKRKDKERTMMKPEVKFEEIKIGVRI